MSLLRHFLCDIVIVAILLVSFGCGDNTPSEPSAPPDKKLDSNIQYGGEYRVPLANVPATLDPARIGDIYGISVAFQLYDRLVHFGPYLSILPGLAENWQVEDNGKKILFTLRSDAIFHHGRKVSTNDVIFSLKRLLRIDPAPFITPHLLKIEGAQAYRDKTSPQVDGLRSIDEQRLEVHLIEPYAPLLGALAMYQAAIVPQDVVEREGYDFGRNPVGCGPFKFVKWEDNRSILLERNDDYFGGPAYLDKIMYRIFPGILFDTVLEDFKSGQLHEMPVYGAVRQQLSAIKNLQWIHRPSLSLLYYGINTKNSGLKDVRLRKAIALAIDRKQLVETVYKGQFQPAYSVIPPGMPAHNRNANLVELNISEAKALITQIKTTQPNWSSTIEIVSASKSAFARAELDFFEKAMAAIGIKAIQNYITDWQNFKSYLKSDAVQIYRSSWTADIPDPDNFLYPLFGADSSVNDTRYLNSDIEAKLKQASGLVDPVQRSRLYHQIEKQAMQAYPIIPLFYLSIDRVYHSNVKNINITALGAEAVRLNRVWLSSSVN